MQEDWRHDASCKNEDKRHFYAHEEGERIAIPERIIQMCESCSVKLECLNHALDFENYGYWGGTTAKERREMRLAAGVRIQRLESRIRFFEGD